MQVFTELEEKIVRHLAKHIQQNDEISLTALADECYVSKATVIKAVKKLGFEGFGDFQHSIRFNVQAQDGVLLPRRVCKQDIDLLVHLFAQALYHARGKRNFIFSGDRRTGRVIANYMSRKLALFDIFAPASYDYMFARQVDLDVGLAIFCFHKELPQKSLLGQQMGYGDGMLETARDAGFTIVAISDEEPVPHEKDIEILIPIAESAADTEDLYIPKVLIFFEQVLAELSCMFAEREDI